MFSGFKNIKTEQTVEALGLVGDAPEEQARVAIEDTRA
jgi:hypothetical protein